MLIISAQEIVAKLRVPAVCNITIMTHHGFVSSEIYAHFFPLILMYSLTTAISTVFFKRQPWFPELGLQQTLEGSKLFCGRFQNPLLVCFSDVKETLYTCSMLW